MDSQELPVDQNENIQLQKGPEKNEVSPSQENHEEIKTNQDDKQSPKLQIGENTNNITKILDTTIEKEVIEIKNIDHPLDEIPSDLKNSNESPQIHLPIIDNTKSENIDPLLLENKEACACTVEGSKMIVKDDALAFDLFVKERQKELGIKDQKIKEISLMNKFYEEWANLDNESKQKFIEAGIEKKAQMQKLTQCVAEKAVKAEENIINETDATIKVDKDIKQDVVAKKKFELLMTQIKTMFGLHYMKNDNVPSEISPGLFLGSIGAALSKKSLEDNGITHIICCCDNVKCAFPNDFTYKIYPLLDKPSEDIRKYFEEASDYIQSLLEEGKRVLVHCFAGKSRSTTILISYFIKHKKMCTDEALEVIRKKRPVAGPNMGFIKQLKDYEQLLNLEMKN